MFWQIKKSNFQEKQGENKLQYIKEKNVRNWSTINQYLFWKSF